MIVILKRCSIPGGNSFHEYPKNPFDGPGWHSVHSGPTAGDLKYAAGSRLLALPGKRARCVVLGP